MNDTKIPIADRVYWVGAKDPDRKSFDALVPLPIGTSYNAYLIEGTEKTALLDTVDPTKLDVLMTHLQGVKKIDYIVSHHAEQDHSGSILRILDAYPQAKVVTTPKGRDFLGDLIHLPAEKTVTVKDREKLALGGKTLEFFYIPWAHWPETMASFLHEDRILFPCDLFGTHWAKDGLIEKDKTLLEDAAKRYYAEIMMPYAKIINRHLPIMKSLEPKLIATSHGPLHDDPDFIIDRYEQWIQNPPRNLVVIPYVTMHGSTEKIVEHLKSGLEKKGIEVKVYNAETFDAGEYAMDLVDAATVIFAAPTVVTGVHPHVASAAFLTNILRPKMRWCGVVGSYGWGSRAADQVKSILQETGTQFLDPLLFKGLPTPANYRKLDEYINLIAKNHETVI